MQLIVAQGNDYLVGVKANQPKLLEQFVQTSKHQTPSSVDVRSERTRERVVERTVQVFPAPSAVAQAWSGATSMIVVHRRGTRSGQPFERTSYYLSSLSVDATSFGVGIRGHRQIENGLHWVKDVVLQEDAAPFSNSNPATIWSIIRTIVLNLVRQWGYRSLTKAQRFLRHDIDKLFHLLTKN